MRSLVLTVSFLCAGGAGTAWYTKDDHGEWQAACTSYEEERERSGRLEARIAQRRACAAYCNKQIVRVVLGATHLADACRNIEAYAAVHYPRFLEEVSTLGRGRTLREKLANNVVAGCFVVYGSEHAARNCNPAVALRLAVELAETIETDPAHANSSVAVTASLDAK